MLLGKLKEGDEGHVLLYLVVGNGSKANWGKRSAYVNIDVHTISKDPLACDLVQPPKQVFQQVLEKDILQLERLVGDSSERWSTKNWQWVKKMPTPTRTSGFGLFFLLPNRFF